MWVNIPCIDPMKYEQNKFESEIQHCFDSNQKKRLKRNKLTEPFLKKYTIIKRWWNKTLEVLQKKWHPQLPSIWNLLEAAVLCSTNVLEIRRISSRNQQRFQPTPSDSRHSQRFKSLSQRVSMLVPGKSPGKLVSKLREWKSRT